MTIYSICEAMPRVLMLALHIFHKMYCLIFIIKKKMLKSSRVMKQLIIVNNKSQPLQIVLSRREDSRGKLITVKRLCSA